MTDQHAINYYAAPGRETATQAGPVQNWTIPTDNIAGPTGGVFSGPSGGAGTNAVNYAGLGAMAPTDVANSNIGPIPPDVGVIPTI
jgi:hypothetical protein